MKVTLTRQAVNHVNQKCNSVPAAVFIDRLKDGRKSLKVWGWTAAQYMQAVDFLLDRGCKVHVVKTDYSGFLRLHVKES